MREQKTWQGNTHRDAMRLLIYVSICMHMYAHCIHIQENCLEMLKRLGICEQIVFETSSDDFRDSFDQFVLPLLRCSFLDRSRGVTRKCQKVVQLYNIIQNVAEIWYEEAAEKQPKYGYRK